jgi:hypothetical protein
VIHDIHDQIITGLIKDLDQRRTAYDASSKDELSFLSRADTAESQFMIFNGQSINRGIEWSNKTDWERVASDGTREYEDQLSKDVAVDGLDDHKVMSLLAMELGAAIDKAIILIKVDLGLIGNLEWSVLSNLDGVKDGRVTTMKIAHKIIWTKINCTW